MDIIKKLDEEYKKDSPPENSITINQYAEHMKISRDKAKGFIRKMVLDGILVCVGKFGSKRDNHYMIKEG